MIEKVRERERPMYSELSPFNSYQIDMKVINEENKLNDRTPPAFINKYFRPDSCSFLAVMCSRYIEPIVIGVDKFTVWGRQQV